MAVRSRGIGLGQLLEGIGQQAREWGDTITAAVAVPLPEPEPEEPEPEPEPEVAQISFVSEDLEPEPEPSAGGWDGDLEGISSLDFGSDFPAFEMPPTGDDLEARVEVWLAAVGIGGAEKRHFDPAELLAFARMNQLEEEQVEDLYQQFAEDRMAQVVSLEELELELDEVCDAIGDRIDELVCPITLELMVDPVVAADGRTYERAAIEEWLSEHDTSPLTNLALPTKQLRPNLALLAMLAKYHQAADVTGEGFESRAVEIRVIDKCAALLANLDALKHELARFVPADVVAQAEIKRWQAGLAGALDAAATSACLAEAAATKATGGGGGVAPRSHCSTPATRAASGALSVLKRHVVVLLDPMRALKGKVRFWHRLAESESRAEQLIHTLYSEAILGNRLMDGAIAQGEEMLRAWEGDQEAAVKAMARLDASKSFARGALAGVGGFTTMLLTIPASVLASTLVNMRLAFAIAHICAHDVWEPRTCNAAFAVMSGESAAAVPELSGGGAGAMGAGLSELASAAAPGSGAATQKVATKLVEKVAQEQFQRQLAAATQRGLTRKAAEEAAEGAARRAAQGSLETLTQQGLAEQAGMRLARTGGSRSLAKAIPLVGAAIGGAVEVYTTVGASASASAVPIVPWLADSDSDSDSDSDY